MRSDEMTLFGVVISRFIDIQSGMPGIMVAWQIAEDDAWNMDDMNASDCPATGPPGASSLAFR